MTKKRTNGDVYVKRTANRRYKVIGGGNTALSVGLFGACGIKVTPSEPVTTREVLTASEYAVYRHPSPDPVARIVKAQDGWRVVVETVDSRFGRAVSPVGLDGFREVSEWAMEHFSTKEAR